jgi:Tfp pilus assembly protein PilX
MKQGTCAQAGLALPTVLALAMLCSVLLVAEWRSLALAQGFGHMAQQRWTLQQASHAALLAAVQDIRGPLSDARHQPGAGKSTQAFFPQDLSAWQTLQNRLNAQDCLSGICIPLGAESNHFGPWQARLAQAQNFSSDSRMTVVYWVEVLPLIKALATTNSPFVYRITVLAQAHDSSVVVTQALWHPTPSHPASNATPMNLAGFKRLLQLSP